MTRLKPLGFTMIIKADSIEEVTKSGIILHVDSMAKKLAQHGQMHGTVIAIGSLAYSDKGDGTPWCEVGDRVVYRQYAGKFVFDPDDETEYVLLNDEDVVVLIEDKEEDE